MSSSVKVKVQSFGRFLSNMVMPNIGAFIAWGIITALFIPTGWIPNETLAKLVGPMITYLLPLLIGFTGGRLVGGDRGGVVGAITTMGVIVGADMPMFLGSMIAGRLAGWAIKSFDRAVDGKIKSGFEMLVNNFSAGIIGMVLALIAFMAIGPLVEGLSHILAAGVNLMVQNNLLPLTSIFVEPAKILFLNNAINHGIFSPLGIQQASEACKSIFFLIEANPGPGMGVLVAYMIFGRCSAKQSAGGAAIINFLGGIHEIYFPYVLMAPRLLLAVILGGMTGVFTLTLLNGGLVSPASPGSILAVLAMTPKGAYFANIAAIVAAFAVSFVVSSVLLKTSKVKEDDDIEAATKRMHDMKAQSKGQAVAGAPVVADANSVDVSHVRKIIVACDAGMVSSAMGAGVLRKKVQDAGLSNISITNSAINSLPGDVDLVITHRDLTERAMRQAPQAQHISLNNFLDSALYTNLTDRMVAANRSETHRETVQTVLADSYDNSGSHLFKLGADNVFLGLSASNKEQAIRFAGESW